MVRNRNFSDRDPMGGRGAGPAKAPGMGRGESSVKLKNPAPKPERGGFDGGMLVQPDAGKVRSMMKKEHMVRESGRGKGSL
jgi:hypothetical protein